MPTEMLCLIALPPLLAALILATGLLTGRIQGEHSERTTARIALAGALASLVWLMAAAGAKAGGQLPDQTILGAWVHSGTYRINLSYRLDGLGLAMASLVAFIGLLTLKFSVDYLHREAGYHRFFMIMSLFLGAMLLLVTAGNVALTFVGWELAGVCSYLLIGYAYDRPNAARNATRAILTNRVSDAGFLIAIFLCQIWIGSLEWDRVADGAEHMGEWQTGVLTCCFLLAAMGKSAQLPFSPWLARAIEGPTPSSAIFYGAIMVHAGVYLILRLQAVFPLSPTAMDLLFVVGAATALYGWFCGLSQSDVKSALIFSTTAQIGLMFLEMGLGWWQLATWHLMSHACVRAYQFLTAPSLMHQVLGLPPRPVPGWMGRSRFLYLASLRRLWIEPIGDRYTTEPILNIGADLQAFEAQIIDPAFGLPAGHRHEGTRPKDGKEVLQASGLAGSLTYKLANWLHWFEEKLVLQGLGQDIVRTGRRLGTRLNHLEDLLNRPRYLVALIIATLMLVF